MSAVSMFMKIFARSRRRVIKMHGSLAGSACRSSATGEGIFLKPNIEEFY